MNATSLYVSTSRLVFQADPEDSTSWSDLYRLIPYLRQSLSCTVCGNLLIEPYTPTETNCQHHVCRSCKGRKKKLKPSCSWCKDYDKYVENVQLRILLQCYKKLCEYIANSSIYRRLIGCNSNLGVGGSNLIDLIHEGSGFKDEFKSSSDRKPTLSIVSSVYTSTSTQTASVPVSGGGLVVSDYSLQINKKDDQISEVNNLQNIVENNGIENNIDNPTVYSVMYGGCGSKLTLKRTGAEIKNEEQQIDMENIPIIEVSEKTVQTALRFHSNRRRARSTVKKPPHNSIKGNSCGSGSSSTAKSGCRCGNATATPGKLTCCGQRCPCYTDSKACRDCKCRGCRNPHTSDGHKVRPVISDLQNYLHLDSSSELTTLSASSFTSSEVPISVVPTSSATVQVVGMYTTQLHNVSSSSSSSTAPGIILDGNSVVTTDHDANEIGIEI